MARGKSYTATADDEFSVPLYHATTAKYNIYLEGFKTIGQIAKKRRGLGGLGSSEKYTSFTASKNIASVSRTT